LIVVTRIVAIALLVIGVLALFGSFDEGPKGVREVAPIALVMLAVGVFLLIQVQRRVARRRKISLNRKLLELAQATGTLTVPQVVAGLSLTGDEAKAALTGLSHDGLAQFDIDAEGAPVYRVSKLRP